MGYQETIKRVEDDSLNTELYEGLYCGVLVITHDNKILLQQRPDDWRTYPGCLSTFGGKVEDGESPEEALVRELMEELGAIVHISDVVKLGAITESYTNHKELIYTYFWKDVHNTITGCYECEAKYYKNKEEALQHPKIMDDVCWLLHESSKKGLIS